jgi:hypothetical protein
MPLIRRALVALVVAVAPLAAFLDLFWWIRR